MPAPKKYPDELRERAVRYVVESGRPVPEVARDLGIKYESLRRWVRQAEADAGKRTDLLTTAEREEIRKLRRENRELRRANEILSPPRCFSPRSSTQTDRSERVYRRASLPLRVEPICLTLDVSASAYHERRKGRRSKQEVSDVRLLAEIEQVHAQSYGAYSSRRGETEDRLKVQPRSGLPRNPPADRESTAPR